MNRLDAEYTLPALTTGNATLLCTPWYDVGSLYSFGMGLHTLAAGSPVGTWSFDGSNDRTAIERLKNLVSAPLIADSVRQFTLTSSIVHGSALAVTGGVAFNSFVIFADLPRFIRARFTYASGGTASSFATVLTCGRE